MATGSTTDDEQTVVERVEQLPSPGTLARRLVAALVLTPGRSTAMALVVVPYLWLGTYMVGTALGLRSDPIVAGDWLTLVFTSYALLSSLGLAHRILKAGLRELTEEYLVDALALTWLTAFYFVWMLARESVSESTTVAELYRPVVDGQPEAVAWAAVVGVTALVVAGLVHRPSEETKLFSTEFRTALVTVPGAVTATVLVLRPGPTSVVWPLVGGAFLGSLLGGLLRIQRVASWTAKGAFAVCSLAMWSVGALAWALAHRSRPPNSNVVLAHVAFGGADAAGEASTESPTEPNANSHGPVADAPRTGQTDE